MFLYLIIKGEKPNFFLGKRIKIGGGWVQKERGGEWERRESLTEINFLI